MSLLRCNRGAGSSQVVTQQTFRAGWRRAGLGLACAALAGAALVSPVAADWLVTTEGQRVETSGPWQVKGKLVVFTRPNGTLASLRLSEVDLDGSKAATAAALAPPKAKPPAAPAAKKPVLVLTDKDIKKHVNENGDEQLPPGGTPAPAEETGVVVDSWSDLTDPESSDVQILGTLRNTAAEIATNVSVVVRLWDDGRQLIEEKIAAVNPNTLASGGTVNFRVTFEGVASYGTATFEVTSSARGKLVPSPDGKPPGPERTETTQG